MQNGYIGSVLTPTRERKKRRNIESLRMYVSENSFKIYYTFYLCVFSLFFLYIVILCISVTSSHCHYASSFFRCEEHIHAITGEKKNCCKNWIKFAPPTSILRSRNFPKSGQIRTEKCVENVFVNMQMKK